MKYTYNELLMCELSLIEIVKDDQLHFYILGSPDMSKAIKMAKSVLPDVRKIICIDDRKRYCMFIYELTDLGRWDVTMTTEIEALKQCLPTT